jgi:predicted anti-sigma-YlaC factor YlaD
MTCRQLIDFLDDYLCDELPLTKQAAFRLHLLLCSDCRAYIDSYRRTIAISKSAMNLDDAVPRDVPPKLIAAIKDAMSKE